MNNRKCITLWDVNKAKISRNVLALNTYIRKSLKIMIKNIYLKKLEEE